MSCVAHSTPLLAIGRLADGQRLLLISISIIIRYAIFHLIIFSKSFIPCVDTTVKSKSPSPSTSPKATPMSVPLNLPNVTSGLPITSLSRKPSDVFSKYFILVGEALNRY
jgi:hypothetical protein